MATQKLKVSCPFLCLHFFDIGFLEYSRLIIVRPDYSIDSWKLFANKSGSIVVYCECHRKGFVCAHLCVGVARKITQNGSVERQCFCLSWPPLNPEAGQYVWAASLPLVHASSNRLPLPRQSVSLTAFVTFCHKWINSAACLNVNITL